MPDIFIYNLTTIGGIDASNDWMIIEDTSTGETKKAAPGQLPISTATQAALDTKVDENAPITGATKTKITYDAKGLVTAGADLSASDMPTGIDAAKIGTGVVSNTEFGYLDGVTSAIQTQLNSKQGSLTLTTTGSSGAATLIGNTLNIPQYTGGSGSGVSSLEGLTGALQLSAGSGISITDNGTDTITITATGGGGGSGTVTSVGLTTGTSGTDINVSNSPITTSGNITLNIPVASSSNTGKLSSTDWSTFNGKQDTLVSGTNIKTVNSTSLLGSGDVAVQATLVSGTNIKTINSTSLLGSGDITISASPSGVSGAIQFSNGSAFASDAANLFFDDTNNRLGVGTNAPSATGHFKGSGSTSATTSLLVTNSSGLIGLIVTDDGSVSSYGKGGQTTNAAFGGTSLSANTSGSLNAGFGFASLNFNTTGGSNTAIGFQSGYGNGTGSNNTSIGRNANISVANYSDNTAVGAFADCGGFSGCTILGKSAVATANNQFVVGSSTTNAGAIDSSAFTQDKRWKVKINGVDYYIALQTA